MLSSSFLLPIYLTLFDDNGGPVDWTNSCLHRVSELVIHQNRRLMWLRLGLLKHPEFCNLRFGWRKSTKSLAFWSKPELTLTACAKLGRMDWIYRELDIPICCPAAFGRWSGFLHVVYMFFISILPNKLGWLRTQTVDLQEKCWLFLFFSMIEIHLYHWAKLILGWTREHQHLCFADVWLMLSPGF